MAVYQNEKESEEATEGEWGKVVKERMEHTSAYLGEGSGGDCSIVAFCDGLTNSSTAAAGIARFEEDDDDDPGVVRSDKDN